MILHIQMVQAIIILDLLEITLHILTEEDILDLVHLALCKVEALAHLVQVDLVVDLEEAQVVDLEVAAR